MYHANTHPARDPEFNPNDRTPVWYMAHPLTTDDRYTYEQNMEHVVHMMRVLFDCGLRVVAPYHTCCLALDDTNPEHRRIGLELDCEIVRRLGHLVLMGHKLSTGMSFEVNALMDSQGVALNFIGWKDEEIRNYFELKENLERAFGI